MKTMPIPQKISISEVCIYPKAHPWNSAKDPGFTGLLSPAGQSLVSLDFVQNLCSMMYLLPPCTIHLLFFHCPSPHILCVLFIQHYLHFLLLLCHFMLIRSLYLLFALHNVIQWHLSHEILFSVKPSLTDINRQRQLLFFKNHNFT